MTELEKKAYNKAYYACKAAGKVWDAAAAGVTVTRRKRAATSTCSKCGKHRVMKAQVPGTYKAVCRKCFNASTRAKRNSPRLVNPPVAKCKECGETKAMHKHVGRDVVSYRTICPDCVNVRARRRNKVIRVRVLSHYSLGVPTCACCGETELDFLALDHIHRGGQKHRKEIAGGTSGVSFYRWVETHGFPDILQVLCHNCNCAKGFYGVCPHQVNKAA